MRFIYALLALVLASFLADVESRLSDLQAAIKAKVRLRARLRQHLDNIAERLKSMRKRARKLRKKLKRDRDPTVVITANVVNQSDRGGVKPRLMVLHSTESPNREGTSDLQAIVNIFDTASYQASSHVITDGEGKSARCVPDARKAWTQVAFNSVSLSVEQIGYAAAGSWPEEQLRETARWLAKWSREFDIPLVRGAVSGSSVTRSGVVTHSQLGSAGGGHSDPGAGYPVDRVIELAKGYR